MSSKAGIETPDTRGRPLSLAARLTLWYGVTGFVLIAAATGFLYAMLVASLDREDDEFLADKVAVIAAALREQPGDLHMLREEVEWEPAARQYGQIYVRVLGPDGKTTLETPGMSSLPPDGFPSQGVREVDGAGGRSFRLLSAPAGAVTIQIAMDRTREEHLLAGYRRNLALALAVSLVVCLAVGYAIARRGLRPVLALARTAEHIGASTLHERVTAEGLPGELATLARTFNGMLARLQDSFERLSRFSADIAHELRNPVNNLRGEAEVALGRTRSVEEYREVLSSCLEECGRLSRLIDSLLFIARAEDPRTQILREPLDVARELAAVRDFYEPAATEAGVALDVSVAPGVQAALDRTLFQRAVGNLVANALAHTPRGGRVTLSAGAANGAVAIEVADTGDGIAPEHLPHVFDRFYRADAARHSGTGRVGLGLAIVKAITALHGGTASIEGGPGQGTRVRLSFPR